MKTSVRLLSLCFLVSLLSLASFAQSREQDHEELRALLRAATDSLLSLASFAQSREQDHEELRALLRAATEAMNAKNFDALAPLFNDQFSITTVDQKLFTSIADFKAYYESLMSGPNAPLKSIAFKPEADDLTVFVGDNIGLSHGTSIDTYNFSDGDTRSMTSRWTATVCKRDGKWKILNVHIGTNLLDNPVLAAAKSYLYKIGAGAAIGGLLVGFLIARLLRSRKTVVGGQ